MKVCTKCFARIPDGDALLTGVYRGYHRGPPSMWGAFPVYEQCGPLRDETPADVSAAEEEARWVALCG